MNPYETRVPQKPKVTLGTALRQLLPYLSPKAAVAVANIVFSDRMKKYPSAETLARLGDTPVRLDILGEAATGSRDSLWAEYDVAEARDATARTAGSWADVDVDELVARLYRARQVGSRASARELFSKWLSEDPAYDQNTWPELKDALDTHRSSTRKYFRG